MQYALQENSANHQMRCLLPNSDNAIIINMADSDTEKWALKSKQIEAERMKAAEDLANQKPDKSNLAFLGPKATKVKGWSKDPDVISADAERMGNRALIFCDRWRYTESHRLRRWDGDVVV